MVGECQAGNELAFNLVVIGDDIGASQVIREGCVLYVILLRIDTNVGVFEE